MQPVLDYPVLFFSALPPVLAKRIEAAIEDIHCQQPPAERSRSTLKLARSPSARWENDRQIGFNSELSIVISRLDDRGIV